MGSFRLTDSRITADASERADATLHPNAFRQKYETRRWVACIGGDHTGYKGYDERSDSLVSEEIDAVIGSDPSAAAAVESAKLDIPPETRNRAGGITVKGGLWIALLNGAD